MYVSLFLLPWQPSVLPLHEQSWAVPTVKVPGFSEQKGVISGIKQSCDSRHYTAVGRWQTSWLLKAFLFTYPSRPCVPICTCRVGGNHRSVLEVDAVLSAPSPLPHKLFLPNFSTCCRSCFLSSPLPRPPSPPLPPVGTHTVHTAVLGSLLALIPSSWLYCKPAVFI